MTEPKGSPIYPNRRRWMKTAVQTAGGVVLSSAAATAQAESSRVLPLRSSFPIAGTEVYLNNAGAHPYSKGAIDAIQAYLRRKAEGGQPGRADRLDDEVKAHFAWLINAPASTINLVPRTIAGENLVVSVLDAANGAGNIVTDELHFQGSLSLYRTLQAKGLDVRIIKARNWQIELAHLDKAIDRNTKLVAVSAVSQVNGFQHNLKAVSDLAHARGAYVYADLVQAVGAIPIDVKASGIDFGACGCQKWLMGDMGAGFFYAREGLLADLVRRTEFGIRQITGSQNHLFANDLGKDATSSQLPLGKGVYLDVGTVSQTVISGLSYSLPLIREIGVEAIQAYNAGLLGKVRKEMPRLGYELATPEDSQVPIASFGYVPEKRQAIAAKLRNARVQVKIDQKVIRVSPSIYNNSRDMESLLEALA